jgi:hypothetical protein
MKLHSFYWRAETVNTISSIMRELNAVGFNTKSYTRNGKFSKDNIIPPKSAHRKQGGWKPEPAELQSSATFLISTLPSLEFLSKGNGEYSIIVTGAKRLTQKTRT